MREVDKYILEENKKNKDLKETLCNVREIDEDEDKNLEKKIQKLITKDRDGKIKLFEVLSITK